MAKIQLFLQGKKTYLVAFSAILGFVIAWANGDITTSTMLQDCAGALLAMTLRNGMSNGK